MKFLVLGPNYDGYVRVRCNYKGVDRVANPLPITSSSEKQALAESMFVEIAESLDYFTPDGEYISDIKLAEKASQIYTNCATDGQQFSVYEITYPFEPPKVKKRLLGYDILMDGNSSMVALIFGSNVELSQQQKEISQTFKKYLNDCLLFSDIDVAFDVYRRIRNISDEATLSDEVTLSIVGVYE